MDKQEEYLRPDNPEEVFEQFDIDSCWFACPECNRW